MSSLMSLFVFNLIWYSVFAFGLCAVLERRFGWLATVLVFAACIAVNLSYGLAFEFRTDNTERPGTAIRLLILVVAYFLPACLLFRDKWYKSLFVSGACFAFQLVGDMLASSLLIPREILQGGSMVEVPANLLTVTHLMITAIILLLTWLFVLLLRNRRFQLAPAEWLLFFLFPLSQIVLLGGWQFVSMSEFTPNRVLVMALGLGLSVAADGLLFFAMRGMAQRRRLASEKDLLEQQVALQTKHYAALTEQYEDMRHMRHDIANHLETMKALLETGQYTQAADYTQNAVDWFRYHSQLGACENPVADAFLHAAAEKLKARGVTPELHITVPRELPIANADLIAAFGNLLDNAAEACEKSKEKTFTMTAAVSRGFLVIRTDNAAVEETAPKRRRIAELPRGLGHQILQSLAEKYDGSFRTDKENGVYTATLALNTEGTHAADRNL